MIRTVNRMPIPRGLLLMTGFVRYAMIRMTPEIQNLVQLLMMVAHGISLTI